MSEHSAPIGLVLVVEDNSIVRSLVSQCLRSEGYRVEACESGDEAVLRLAVSSDVPDLIVLDLVMRGVDGYGVLQFISEQPHLGRLKVIAMTAVPRPKVPPGIPIIKKPMDMHRLAHAVRETLGTP